jgi:flagellar biogenesis protein FliO
MSLRRRGAIIVALTVIALTGRSAAAKENGEPRPWLAQSAPAAAVAGQEDGPSPWRIGGIALLLVGLAAAAVLAKRHQRRASGVHHVPNLAVVGTVRLGGKSQLVLASVAGRLVLLGVTESNVRKLAWIEGDGGAKAAGADAPLFDNLLHDLLDEPGKSDADGSSSALRLENDRGFVPQPAQVPFDSFESGPSAATKLAAQTRDAVETSRSSANLAKRKVDAAPDRKHPTPSSSGIEGQATGLRPRGRGNRT